MSHNACVNAIEALIFAFFGCFFIANPIKCTLQEAIIFEYLKVFDEPHYFIDERMFFVDECVFFRDENIYLS